MTDEQIIERTPYDGRPYYCDTCGLGLAEYNACEDGDCQLESVEEAQRRAQGRCEYEDGPYQICKKCGGEKLGHYITPDEGYPPIFTEDVGQ